MNHVVKTAHTWLKSLKQCHVYKQNVINSTELGKLRRFCVVTFCIYETDIAHRNPTHYKPHLYWATQFEKNLHIKWLNSTIEYCDAERSPGQTPTLLSRVLDNWPRTKLRRLAEKDDHKNSLLSPGPSCPNLHFVTKSLRWNHLVKRSKVTVGSRSVSHGQLTWLGCHTSMTRNFRVRTSHRQKEQNASKNE